MTRHLPTPATRLAPLPPQPVTRFASTLARALLVMALLQACTDHGRTPQDGALSDHTQPTPQERWEQAGCQLKPGSYAPLVRLPFLFPQRPGDTATLDSANHAAHVVLFWASWCSDCQEATPALVALQRDYPHLAWLTVSLDNEAAKARRYVWKHEMHGIHLFDGRNWRGEACTDYAVPLHGIPYMALVDDEGRLRWAGQEADSLRGAIATLYHSSPHAH